MRTQVTVVTGGNRGIGAAITRRLVEAGHRVVVASRTGTGPDDCAPTGTVSMDASSAASIADGLSEIEETYGPVGVLVANAGITKDNLLMRMSDEDIDENLLAGELALSGVPDPDLLIRTGGERRVSNFLLWNLAYAEFWFTDCLWPDFRQLEFEQALDHFARRQRRYGYTGDQVA